MPSENLKQLDLLAKPRPAPPDVSIQTIVRRPTLLRAIHLAQEVSGLEDKQIYDVLGIDNGHWSRIRSGTAHFPADERFIQFLDVVGNDVPLIWLAEKRGFDWTTIRQHRSALDRLNDDLKQEIADHKRTIQLLIERGRP